MFCFSSISKKKKVKLSPLCAVRAKSTCETAVINSGKMKDKILNAELNLLQEVDCCSVSEFTFIHSYMSLFTACEEKYWLVNVIVNN